MSENKNTTVELLKYPLLVFSILIALIIARFYLGLQFGVVTELSSQGVKFAQSSDAASQALTDIDERLNAALVRLEALEKLASSPEVVSRAKARSGEAAQEVSDQVAQAATANRNVEQAVTKSAILPARGYIWIGNYAKSWDSPRLGMLDTGQPLHLAPAKMHSGTEYKVLGNMVLRDGLPANDAKYYKAQKSIGVIPRGQIVRLVSAPVAIDREYAVQYWVEVEAPGVVSGQ